MKAIFLDTDGTLIDQLSCSIEPRRITLCDGAGPALRLLAGLDYRFFLVSNQDGVARGELDEAAVQAVEHRLTDLLFREQVVLDGFYYCPHHPEGSVAAFSIACTCRKPMPGLLLQAAQEHDIDLHASWMIGDGLNDVEAGNRAGCRTLLIDNGNEAEWRLGPRRIPTRIGPDLYAAAVLIVAEDGAAR